jgi:hypothetical protein
MPSTAYVPAAAVYVRDKQQGWVAATVVAVDDTVRLPSLPPPTVEVETTLDPLSASDAVDGGGCHVRGCA